MTSRFRHAERFAALLNQGQNKPRLKKKMPNRQNPLRVGSALIWKLRHYLRVEGLAPYGQDLGGTTVRAGLMKGE